MTQRLITPGELLQAETGIDWASIAESGTQPALETIEQSLVIDRASAWIANFCTQRLDATTDLEQSILGGPYTKTWVDGAGWLWYRTDFFPILSITSVQWAIAGAGSAPAAFNSLDVTKMVTFGEFNRVNRMADYTQDWSWLKFGPGLIKVSYVNGYPNAVLIANSPAPGAGVVLQVDSTLGMSAVAGAIGNTLTIYDGANTEVVTVAGVIDATHVTVATLVSNHNTGVGVSALPSDVKEACILACMDFARERGAEAWTMGTSGSGGGVQSKSGEGSMTLAKAEYLLQPYRRIL